MTDDASVLEPVLRDLVIANRILANENVVGWFQGAMEFGPRALGGRSILGDPRSPKMQETMNLKINLPPNTEPEVYTNRSSISDERVVLRYNLGDNIRFDVIGLDEDNDEVTIN